MGTWDELSALTGRVALVTGAGTGIGRAVATRLAEAGAFVVASDRDLDAAASTAVAIGGESLVLDVTGTAEVDAAIESIGRRHGRLDLLVNNAGVYPARPLLEIDDESWQRVLDINLTGTFRCTRAFAQRAIASGHGGAIVNVASKAAFRPSRTLAHYSASKAGVARFTEAAAIELAPHGIRVNAVAPGPIMSEGGAAAAAARATGVGSADSVTEEFRRRVPLGRLGTPDEIALVVRFLLSDAASFMTGSVVVADGGALLV